MPTKGSTAAVRVKREPSPSPPRPTANSSFSKSKETKRTSNSATTPFRSSTTNTSRLNTSATAADTIARTANDKSAQIAATNAEILSQTGYAHYRSINEALDKRTDWQLVQPHQLQPVLGADEVVAGLQQDDEDIWLFSCAHNVDVEGLLGAKLQLSEDGQRRTLRSATAATANAANSQTLEYQAEVAAAAAGDASTSATLVSMLVRQSRGGRKHQLVSFRPQGTVRVRHELAEPTPVEAERTRGKLVPYPGGLKVRHPLHGAEFEARGQLAGDVERKLRAAVRESLRAKTEEVPEEEEEQPDRRPKVKRERVDGGEEEEKEEEVARKSTAISRKRKAALAESNGADDVADEAPKKAKRVKKEKVKVEDEEPAADLDWLSAI